MLLKRDPKSLCQRTSFDPKTKPRKESGTWGDLVLYCLRKVGGDSWVDILWERRTFWYQNKFANRYPNSIIIRVHPWFWVYLQRSKAWQYYGWWCVGASQLQEKYAQAKTHRLWLLQEVHRCKWTAHKITKGE